MVEREYCLGFSVFPGVGPKKFKALLATFGSAKDAWSARKGDLQKVLGEVLSKKFNNFRSSFSPREYAQELQQKRVAFVTLQDKEYPKHLAKISNPPFVLFVRGDVEVLRNVIAIPSLAREKQSQNTEIAASPSTTSTALSTGSLRIPRNEKSVIAVVGTRKITQYGRDVTEMFTKELVFSGATIVSGLAMGVDAVAHETAIEHGGKTIAVLGCGVDCCSPEENLPLYDTIINGNGCVISELPLGYPPTKGSFPSRNRIIAGLSDGILVTEGAEDSGALITADYAFKFNRKVFAVPGPITSQLSKGPYKLIEKGGMLVTSAGDVINSLGISSRSREGSENRKKIKGESKEEQMILDLLENEALHFDEIVRKMNADSQKIGGLLSIMEVKDLIKSTDAGFFSIIQ